MTAFPVTVSFSISKTMSVFKDFPGLENLEKKFKDFQGLVRALITETM